MHYLHKILVKIDPEADRTTKISDARDRAEADTECFYELVWDWRETETAGRWSNEYPTNVLLAEDDVETFVEKLEQSKSFQMETIAEDIKRIESSTESLLELIKSSKWEDIYNHPSTSLHWDLWRLRRVIDLLNGIYISDSYFYSVEDGDSRITDTMIAAIRESPEEYALVFFDQHN